MNRVMVDESIGGQFAEAIDRIEICDRSGQLLGYFVPAYQNYDGPECPLADQELDKISREGTGRPLADILADLKSRS